MARMGRPGLSNTQKRELWNHWKAGLSISEIARSLEKNPGSIYGVLAGNGGFIPAVRTRSLRALTLAEREDISRGIAAGASFRRIALDTGRSVSTISREVGRHGGREAYRAADADERAQEWARRPKRCHLANHPRLRRLVAGRLALQWSPEQISGWLKQRYPDQSAMRVSHETIYRSLFIQARGVLKKELTAHLRTHRRMRRSKQASTAGQPRGRIIDAVSISDRPAEIEDRAVPGHWEGDLITGTNNTHIATLVERYSRFTLLVKVAGKDTNSVVTALSRQVRKLPVELRKSLTWDRGGEMAGHKKFTIATDVQVYFCDPRSPWQRGTNENTNRLLRQYFPDGMDLSTHSQGDLNKVARRLNQRPRKTLGFETPADKLNETVASTG